MEGNFAEAEAMMEEFAEPLRLIFQEGNPTSIKVMTELKGLSRREVRLPLVEGSDELVEATKSAIQRYQLR